MDNENLSSFRDGIIKSQIFVVGIVKAGCFELNVGLINIWKSCRMIIKQNLFEHWFVFFCWGNGVSSWIWFRSGISTSCNTIHQEILPVCQSCVVSNAGAKPISDVWTNHFEKWNAIINLCFKKKSWKINLSGWIFWFSTSWLKPRRQVYIWFFYTVSKAKRTVGEVDLAWSRTYCL